MIAFACPHCQKRWQIPDSHAGNTWLCIGCDRLVSIRITPDGTQALKASPAEIEAYLSRKAGIPQSPSVFLGIIAPLACVAWGVWFGFVKQDILAGGTLKHAGRFVTGPAAVWGGMAMMAMAATLHAACFWYPRPAFRDRAMVVGVLALLAFFGATGAALLMS
jgi:hypothetical protein